MITCTAKNEPVESWLSVNLHKHLLLRNRGIVTPKPWPYNEMLRERMQPGIAMQRQSGSVLDAYIASQATAGSTAGLTPWASLQNCQVPVQLGVDRPGGAGVPPTFGSSDPLAFSSSAAANFGRDYSTLVRPHPQHHQVADARAGSKPYNPSEAAAYQPAAWQRDSRASTATQDPWAFAQPRQTMFGYGNDSLSSWQQQLANLQQAPATEQNAQPQQQGWPPGNESLVQTEQHQLLNQLQHQQPQPQLQQQQQPNPQIVRKPSSGDQLVQDLRAHWGSMASPPPQAQLPLTSTLPQPLAAPPSQSGFEHMWGPTPAPPLMTQSALGLPPSQPGTTPASRLSEDAALLDFPDWDGPGGGAPSLDDMIMNSIGVQGGQATSDSLLPQLGPETSQQAAAADQHQHTKAASKKKQRGGKKAAAKGSKGARAASGSVAQHADSEEEVIVEFFVPADEVEADLEPRESKIRPVMISKAEPEAKPLPASALSAVHASLPPSDPGMHVLQWAFAGHLPKAWTVQ